MSFGWGACPACDAWLDWDDIDDDDPTCLHCDAPIDIDRGDDYESYDDPGRYLDDRCVGPVNPMGASIR